MAIRDVWDKIELSESYLVCSMFEKAASLASSVMERILKADSATTIDDIQLSDMMESAGMVLVQSLKELERTPEILKELKILFGSVTNIPIQVLLTGACFQISEGCHLGLCEILEEFLGKWRYVDEKCYVVVGAEQNVNSMEIDKYLEVVEIYAVALVGGILNNTDLAIAWVEKAELPDEKRQELLRRLRSLYSLKATQSEEETSLVAHKNEETSRGNGGEQTILRFTKRVGVEPRLWWFRTVSMVVSHGKIALLGSFIIFVCFLVRKKRASLKQIATTYGLSIKKGVVDLWQLAFSVQVNPLAAVQPHPALSRGTRG